MTHLRWTPVLDVGIETMNDEHRELIELMNRFAELAEGGAPHAESLAALERLGERTRAHFAHEEEVMAAMKYAKFEQHCRIHRKLLMEFETRVEAFEASGEAEQLVSFLQSWIRSHIRTVDGGYAKQAATG